MAPRKKSTPPVFEVQLHPLPSYAALCIELGIDPAALYVACEGLAAWEPWGLEDAREVRLELPAAPSMLGLMDDETAEYPTATYELEGATR